MALALRFGRTQAVALLLGLAVGLFVGTDGLGFPLEKDERHFFPSSLYFADNLPPTPEVLRGSRELNTPLPLVAFGILAKTTGLGVRAGRALNLLLAMLLLAWLLVPRGAEGRDRLQASFGLFLFPYFAFCAVHLYTDMLAAALAVAGVVLHRKGRPTAAAVALLLAVASRQPMVAFPAGLLLWELGPERRHAGRLVARVSGPLVAVGSLALWFLLYGGLSPPAAVARLPVVAAVVGHAMPRHALYFLACLGAYFALPELALFASARTALRAVSARTVMLLAAPLLALFFFFPPVGNVHTPTPSMGALDVVLRRLTPDGVRIAVLWLLALLATVRLSRRPFALPTALTLTHAIALSLAPAAWDKYALALLPLLWSSVVETPPAHGAG